MSKGFQFLNQVLNFITAFILLHESLSANRQPSDPNKRFSHISSICEESRYFTLLEHLSAFFSRREELKVVFVYFDQMRKRC